MQEFKPQLVAVLNRDEAKLAEIASCRYVYSVVSGMEGYVWRLLREVNLVLNSVVGMVGLRPPWQPMMQEETLPLANKGNFGFAARQKGGT